MSPPGLRDPERFHEEGESANCRLNRGRVHLVVVFNLTRFARNKYDHFALRSHLQSLGISLRSATDPTNVTLASSKNST